MPDTEAEATDAVAEIAVEVVWPLVLTLAYPVTLGTTTIDKLTFQRGQLIAMKGLKVDVTPTAEQLMMIASRLSGQPLRVIELLDPDDAGEVIEIALAFFVRCLGPGKIFSRSSRKA